MRAAIGRLALAAALLPLTPRPALAQDDPAPDPLRERTGPNAAPRSLPDYPTAPAFPGVAPPATAEPAASGTIRFADIAVTANSGAMAVPRDGWRPTADPVSGLRLDHRPGEALDAAWVKRQFSINGMIGTPVPLDRIVGLVQQINLAFVANGFINSGVLIAGQSPADGGVLQLSLVLGSLVPAAPDAPVVAVQWPQGSHGLGAGFVRERMPSAAELPLNAMRLERDFRLLAENPAIRTVNADLRPGGRPGEATLSLIVHPQPRFDFYLTAANNRAPSIGGERFAAGGSIRNLFGDGDLISAESGLTSGRGDVILGYETPFIDPQTVFSLRGGYNEAAVVDRPLLPLDIEASDLTMEAGVARRIFQRPLTPGAEPGQWQSARTMTLGLRLAHRRSITTLLGRRFSFSPGSVNGRSEYSALRFTADWVQRGISEVAAISLTATQGFGETRSDIPGLLSPETDFRVLLAQLSYARRLDDAGLELRARVAGQVADSLLYSGERFAAGGEYTVRGYRETLVLADMGANASMELARPFSLTGGRRDARGVDWGAFQVSVFVDGAWLKNVDGPAPVPNELASVGLSLAWVPSEAVFARITFAESLIDAPIAGTRDLQDRGFQFRITIRPLALFR